MHKIIIKLTKVVEPALISKRLDDVSDEDAQDDEHADHRVLNVEEIQQRYEDQLAYRYVKSFYYR